MPDLLSPITIKAVTFHNRIAMPPMVRMKPQMPGAVVDTGGEITDAVVDHYVQRAEAGTALIIVEATAVDAGGRVWANGLNAFADEHVPGLKRLASAIAAAGCVPGIQIVHGGPNASPDLCGGYTVGPSAVPPTKAASVPRALNVPEIEAIEGRFAEAATRVLDAGFRVVVLHGAHGYLLDSFLSTHRNQRTDAYGSDREGRRRLLVEAARRVRERVPASALLACRISAFNHMDEGYGVEDLRGIVQGLEAAGVDLLDLSTDGALNGVFGADKTLGQWVREMTSLPTIVAGNLQDPADANRAVSEGHADLAAVGRGMLWDARWAANAAAALGA